MRPCDENEVVEIVRAAMAQSRRLQWCGGGSKRDIGAAEEDSALVDLRGLQGIIDYDPSELVLTVRAGTPWAEIERALAAERQMLACEPLDVAGCFGRSPGEMTMGGLVASGLSGPRRVVAGSVRDHVLGFRAVSGRGELFVGGGKVVKNVTGYDLCKLMAGSFGTLALLLTVRFVRRPEARGALAVVIGLLLGLAFWCHILAIIHVAAVGLGLLLLAGPRPALLALPHGLSLEIPALPFRCQPKMRTLCAQLPKAQVLATISSTNLEALPRTRRERRSRQ